MPQTIRTFNDAGQDREVDALWAAIKALQDQLAGVKPSPTLPTSIGDSAPTGLITVTNENGDPDLQVSGLEFSAADGFTVSEDNGLALINFTGAGGSDLSISATTPIVASPNPITSAGGTLSHATSGVGAGSYTNADITVDAKGHVTAAANGSSSSGVSAEVSGFGSVGPQPLLNFIAGANMTSIVAANDAPNSRINLTFNAASPGGGGSVIDGHNSNAYGTLGGYLHYEVFDSSISSYTLPSLVLPIGSTPITYIYIFKNRQSGTVSVLPFTYSGGGGADTIDGGSTYSVSNSSGSTNRTILCGIAHQSSDGNWNRIL